MLILKNNSGGFSKVGAVVMQDPKSKDAFVYATKGSTKVLGVVTESVHYRALCKIATQGEETKVLVSGNIVSGNTLRLGNSTDNVSLGTCLIAKDTDAPYLKIGDARSSGRGIISCVLTLTYQSIVTNTRAVSEYANNAAAIAAGLKTGEYYRTGEFLKIVY
jgi:hypothetical protein